MSTGNPQKWHKVYAGDKECKFFKALTISPNVGETGWRGKANLAKETGLTTKELDAIIGKYIPSGMVEIHPEDGEKVRYWERSSKKKPNPSIADTDKKKRIEAAQSSNSGSCASGNCGCSTTGSKKAQSSPQPATSP